MKNKIRVLCILMALVLSLGSMALMTGCFGDGTPNFVDREWDAGEVPISEERAAAMENESNTVRVVFPGNDPNNPNSQLNQAMHRFTEHNDGHRVEFIPVGHDASQIQQVLIASILANMPYDVVYVTSTDFNLYYSGGLLQAWDDYLNYDWLMDTDVVAIEGRQRTNPLLNTEAIDNTFTRQGRRYAAVPFHNVGPFMAFFNRTYLESLDLDDPYELWRNDEWTMEAMHDMAWAATRDTGNTGTPNYWGITTVYEGLWVNQNHTSFATMDNEGRFQLNLEDPALTEALELITDIWHTRRSVQSTPDPRTAFYQGNTLFLLSEFGEASLLQRRAADGELPFEFDMVPLPFGPNNTDRVNMVFSHGAAMVAGTHNPHTAALVMEYIVQEGTMTPSADIIPLEDKWQEMYEIMVANSFYAMSYDIIVGGGDWIIQAARNGQDIAEAIERQRSQMQVSIDTANRGWEAPVIREHDPYTIDFNDWTDANLLIPENGQDFTTLELITGADAIEGTSVKISTEDGPTSGTRGSFMLDPGVFPLFHPSLYVIEFDLRILGDLQRDDEGELLTNFFVAMGRGERGNVMADTVRWLDDQLDSDDDVISIRMELSPLLDSNADFALVFGGVHWTDIVIDNLRVSQARQGD